MKKKMAAIIAAIVLLTVMMNQAFADNRFSDTENHWGREYIDFLVEKGAIKGYTDGTFKPDNKISRAEFTAILLRALNSDVRQPLDGKWYDNYITEATNRKYIIAGEFDDVEKNITRGEIARMIVRAMNEEYPANIADYASQLFDFGKTPKDYQDYVLKAYVKGIITGRPGGVFAYSDLATRAEATTMIVRLIDKTKRIIPAEPEKPANEDIYIREVDLREEVKVTSSYPELLDAIRFALTIMPKDDERLELTYSKEYNSVQFRWFKSKEERYKSIYERKVIIQFYVNTEKDPRAETYLPYTLSIADTTDESAQEIFKALAKEIFPDAYSKIEKELQNKINDENYQGRVWEKVNGREIRIFTFSGYKQVDMYAELKNK